MNSGSNWTGHLRKFLMLGLLGLFLSSCSTLGYYWQAASGELAILNQRKPIDDVLKESGIDIKLRKQLQLAQQARDFASQKLLLPDNDSYRNYVDLGRPYAVWNVIATPALSIQPRQWCFLVVGCVSYRGYFAKADALALGSELQQEGMDVYVAGVAAYSTLGYFDDPLLNTMLRNDEADYVGLIFHELAHQLIYVENDTAFNEAFATAVAQTGLQRWFEQQDKSELYAKYIHDRQMDREFHTLLKASRNELQQCYAQQSSDADKYNCKKQAFENLQSRYSDWRSKSGVSRYDHWMAQPLNNAHLAIMSTYHDLVPAFDALLEENQGDLQAFYRQVKALARLNKTDRLQALMQARQKLAQTALP